MHSCGLRTGETRALQAGHVNLDDGHVDVVWSKGNRSRRLPVTTQVAGVLAACDRPRARTSPRARRSSSPPPATRSPRQRSARCSPASGTRRDWPGPPADSSHDHTISGTISPTPASIGGCGRARTSPRCCPTCPVTWATRPSTAPTTTLVEDHPGGRVAVGDCVGQCVRLRKTCKSERAAQIEFGKLLEQAAAGRQTDSDVTVAPAARPVRVNPPGRTCPPGKPTSGISAGPSNPRSGPRRSVRSAAR